MADQPPTKRRRLLFVAHQACGIRSSARTYERMPRVLPTSSSSHPFWARRRSAGRRTTPRTVRWRKSVSRTASAACVSTVCARTVTRRRRSGPRGRGCAVPVPRGGDRHLPRGAGAGALAPQGRGRADEEALCDSGDGDRGRIEATGRRGVTEAPTGPDTGWQPRGSALLAFGGRGRGPRSATARGRPAAGRSATRRGERANLVATTVGRARPASPAASPATGDPEHPFG